jgi:hypothetical protein
MGLFDIEAHPPCLMNISTDIHATREVQDYLLSAVNEGEKMYRNFVNSALSGSGREQGLQRFYASLHPCTELCHAISDVSCQRRVKIRQRKNWGNFIL